MNRPGIRLFCLFFITSIFSISLSAKPFYERNTDEEESVSWFTMDPVISAEWALSLPARRDLKTPMPAEEFTVAADFRELRLDTGIRYQADQFDLTSRAIYMPTFFNSFQAGFGFNWHFNRYIHKFTENDLMVTPRFRCHIGPVFSFENAAGFLFKFTSIDAVRNYRPLLFNLSYHYELLCNWHFLQTSDIWFSITLQDYFDYPMAISPFLKLGYTLEATPGIILGIDCTFKFIDMFYSAVYLNEGILRFSFKVAI